MADVKLHTGCGIWEGDHEEGVEMTGKVCECKKYEGHERYTFETRDGPTVTNVQASMKYITRMTTKSSSQLFIRNGFVL